MYLASLASFFRENSFGHILDTQILQKGLFHSEAGHNSLKLWEVRDANCLGPGKEGLRLGWING